MKKGILFGIAAVLFFSQLALAEQGQQKQQWNLHQGYYAELNAGTNFYYFGVISSDFDASASGTHGFGWNVAGGYNFSPSHAIEVGFMQNYADYEEEDDPELEVSAHTNVGFAAWRGTMPIGERFGIHIKLGLMLLTIPETETKDYWLMLPFSGIGASYAITPKIDFSVQYQGAVYVLAGAGALTAGITYHF
jgi:hypothetical protein